MRFFRHVNSLSELWKLWPLALYILRHLSSKPWEARDLCMNCVCWYRAMIYCQRSGGWQDALSNVVPHQRDRHTPETMDPVDSYFKHSKIGWNPIFAQRREAIYPTEANIAVLDNFGASNSLITRKIIDRFLNYKCDGDTDRYLYRNLQISNFLKDLDAECLRQGSSPDVFPPLALIDDRNNISSSASTPAGNYRQTRGPLNAHQLYIELCKSVWLSIFLKTLIRNNPWWFSDIKKRIQKYRIQNDAWCKHRFSRLTKLTTNLRPVTSLTEIRIAYWLC